MGVAFFLVVRRAILRRAADPNASSIALTQTYQPANGLFTAHYPADFAAKKVAEGSVVITRHTGMATDESVSLISVANPISDDPAEFSRITETEVQKKLGAKGGTFTIGDPRPAKCVTGAATHTGVERLSSYEPALGQTQRVWSCTFMAGGHAYKFGYWVMQSDAARERSLLRRIVEATEIAP
jgi:hypothetical protein